MRRDLTRLITNVPLVLGLAAVTTLLILGLFGERLAPHDPDAQRSVLFVTRADGSYGAVLPPTGPDADHLLGTDPIGRDQWSRILAGARLTLTVVLGAALVRLTVGIVLGLVAGWYGGPVARAVRIMSAGFGAVPQLLLAIILVLLTRAYGVAGFAASLALVGWPEVVEFTSAEVRRVRAAPFMEAARSIGSSGRAMIRRHVLATLAPQLLTVAALETGAVLLLLAELGLIGLFIAGATFYMSETGVPVLPIRDRAPEWSQMLGGMQFYALQDQVVVLIPALFVVLAAVAFGLLADGLRAASDPFDAHGVLPQTFGRFSQALGLALVLIAGGFAGFNLTTATLTMDEGRVLASRTAERTWPGSQLVAGVVRYSTLTHAMERPDRLTFYFRRHDRDEVLRITFRDAARDAIEVRPYETEDEIDFRALHPITTAVGSWDLPLQQAERQLGAHFRSQTPNYLVRAILTWPEHRAAAEYEVTYGTVNRGQLTLRRVCCFNATTGAQIDDGAAARPEEAFPIPADCPATPLVAQRYRNIVGHFVAGAPFILGISGRLWYAGDNHLQYQGGTGALRLVSAATTDPDAKAAIVHNAPAASEMGFAILRLPRAGCWRLTFATSETAKIDLVVYAYPWDCRGRDRQFEGMSLPEGVLREPCAPR